MENLVIGHAQQDNELLIESTSRLKSEGTKTRGSYPINDKKQRVSDVLKNNQRKLAPFISNPIFRNDPKGLTENEVLNIIIKNDFFDKNRKVNANELKGMADESRNEKDRIDIKDLLKLDKMNLAW